MPATCGRLKRRAEFVRVAGLRRKWTTPGLVLQVAPMQLSPLDRVGVADLRVGFTVSRHVGNAVLRNRARRRLRAVATEVMPRRAKTGFDYVIIARATTATRPFDAIRVDLETALLRMRTWRSDIEPHPGALEP